MAVGAIGGDRRDAGVIGSVDGCDIEARLARGAVGCSCQRRCPRGVSALRLRGSGRGSTGSARRFEEHPLTRGPLSPLSGDGERQLPAAAAAAAPGSPRCSRSRTVASTRWYSAWPIAEAHLRLGRMDVDVDLVGRQVEEQERRRRSGRSSAGRDSASCRAWPRLRSRIQRPLRNRYCSLALPRSQDGSAMKPVSATGPCPASSA